MLPPDDDMDELIRRAASHYPLKTDNADWSRVEQGLDESEPEPVAVSYRNVYWLLTLLLIPVLIFISTDSHKNGFISKTKLALTNKKTGITYTEKNNRVDTQNVNPLVKQGADVTASIKNPATLSYHKSKSISVNKSAPKKDIQTLNDLPVKQKPADQQKEIVASTNRGQEMSEAKQNNIAAHNDESTTNVDHNNVLLVPGKTEPVITEQPNEIALDNNSSINNKVNSKQKVHRFYAGITGSADISTIKMQKTSKPGTSVGFLIGYQVNKHIAIEVGAAKSKKNYYSNGKYFDKTSLSIPYNIETVEGYCSMWEIPVTIKYTINPEKKTKFYVQAGASSYLMKKENYDYSAVYNGQYYKHNKVYTNASKNWFAALHLGAGAEKKLSKNSNLRIEPYVRLPLSGMGVGKLNITSMGISAAITKKIF